MSKSKQSKASNVAAVQTAPETPAEPTKPKYLTWPANPKQIGRSPRSYRLYRLNAFEWQCYVTEEGVEQPIGKPDLIELVITKMKAVMRHEGQIDFYEAKTKRDKDAEANAT